MDFKDRFQHLIDTKLVDGKKVTTYRIGKETSVSRVSAENYLSGKQKPSYEKATIIAQYFNVSVDWLIAGTQESPDNDLAEATVPISYLNRTLSQIDELLQQQKKLIDTISTQADIIKKTNPNHPAQDATCANVSGSDLVK